MELRCHYAACGTHIGYICTAPMNHLRAAKQVSATARVMCGSELWRSKRGVRENEENAEERKRRRVERRRVGEAAEEGGWKRTRKRRRGEEEEKGGMGVCSGRGCWGKESERIGRRRRTRERGRRDREHSTRSTPRSLHTHQTLSRSTCVDPVLSWTQYNGEWPRVFQRTNPAHNPRELSAGACCFAETH
eukprot:1713361-Rhodomonas_salina.1